MDRTALQSAALATFRSAKLSELSTADLAQLEVDLDLTAEVSPDLQAARSAVAKEMISRPKADYRAAGKAARKVRGLV